VANAGKKYLAVDIGASGGRLILGGLESGGVLALREVHRFSNGTVSRGGRLCWEYGRLFEEILAGMKKCAADNDIPVSMGVDTWGVDFVLLDESGGIIGDTVAYRDSRTNGAAVRVAEYVPDTALYAKTGIHIQPFNTIYQLWAVRESLRGAKTFLMTPDYFHYLLTGIASNEYTEASTTGLLNAAQKTWDRELLDILGYPQELFGPLSLPGETVGRLRPEIAERVGFDLKVLLPATHDTASAVAAAPLGENSVYISSGTWSLLGIESPVPIILSETGRADRAQSFSNSYNFSNEGGVDYRYRYLKNIMGLWMIQEMRRELGNVHSYSEIDALAEAERGFASVVDVTDERFLAPASMIAEIRAACRESGQPAPETPGELARCIFLSLAKGYAEAIRELEEITGRSFDSLCVVGGGCKSAALNRLTAEETGLELTAGPVEATALGNIAVQMIADEAIDDLASARELIRRGVQTEVR